ncbi:putative NADP-dependent oxidoreductase YfmJ [Pseudoalteromonas sp. P1-26]|nr:putative NADP-dependent oxidoreductase YfmJ [Pseudoalteromonas sp. P1-8]KPZ69205.1 putative NADP-dependent oxidoreductase YfmJ [Pseudoalteromonas sp. P1-26]
MIDYFDQYPEFIEQMGAWFSEGKIKSEETVYHGIENAVDAFLGLFEGINKGKMLVKL